jgi:hypothetical protein
MKGYSLIIIIIIIGLVLVTLLLYNSNKPSNVQNDNFTAYTTDQHNHWDLFLYSSSTPQVEALNDTIVGLASKEDCLSEGFKRTATSGSFTCGYQCKTQYLKVKGGLNSKDTICQITCDAHGCSAF